MHGSRGGSYGCILLVGMTVLVAPGHVIGLAGCCHGGCRRRGVPIYVGHGVAVAGNPHASYSRRWLQRSVGDCDAFWWGLKMIISSCTQVRQ